jgi:hypothetical protein
MLPGLRYEIETDDPAEVPEWEERYLEAIERLARGMNDAAEVIRETMP